jgi:hypothetical protein
MKDILYYPYINVPKSKWTLRALLYYDTVAAIVPQEYLWDPFNSYEPFMYELVRNGFVVPIDPLEILSDSRRVGEEFLQFIQSESFDLPAKSVLFNSGRRATNIHGSKFQNHRIHKNKFHDNLMDNLTELGLARRSEGSWFEVEKTTAKYLMEFWATVLAVKLDRLPATNTLQSGVFSSGKQVSLLKRRAIVLRGLVPFPQETDLGKLLDFKLNHRELLQRFRNRIEGIVLDGTIETGSELFNNRVEELRQRLEELIARMNESRMRDILLGSVCGVVETSAGLATAYGGAGIIRAIGAVGAAAGFINAVHSALKFEKPENIFDQSGMKYLALLDKRLRVLA